MHLFIYAVSDDLADIATDIHTAIVEWIGVDRTHITAINDSEDEKIGMEFEAHSARGLKNPLSFLQTLAKTHKCDFVIGIKAGSEEGIEEDEEICFFGHHEGKADINEVACYLGMES